jgi:hypothetical protein
VAPLTALTSGGEFDYASWPSGPERDAFEHVKELLTTPPVLALPDPDKPYQVRVDASIHGTGAVLLQEDRPVAYASRKFTPAERNYCTFDQEMLALYHACKGWRHYLEGAKHQVEIVTDHQPLVHIPDTEHRTRKQARIVAYLQSFDFKLVYKPGKGNIADPLSRHPTLAVLTRSRTRAQTQHAQDAGDTTHTAAPAASNAQPTPQVVSSPSRVLPTSSEARASAPKPPPLATQHPPDPEPPPPPGHPSLLRDELLAAYPVDPKLVDTTFAEQLDKDGEGMHWCNGRVYVPDVKDLRQRVLREMHDQTYAGHVGVRKTLERVSRVFWWPTVRHDVYQYVTHCANATRGVMVRLMDFCSLFPSPTTAGRSLPSI